MPKIQAGNITMNYDQQEDCSHAPLYEDVPAFNEKTLGSLCKHAG
jgi:hypothetical protein